jgi:two-component system, LuxR family, sensor kinase FixL
MTELEPELPSVQGDRVQLQQIILNLLVNAISAMQDTAAPLFTSPYLWTRGIKHDRREAGRIRGG